LCPSCSKMCCRECITKWLTERKRECPYCRAPLHVHQLVNFRLMDDIYAELERLEQQRLSSPRASSSSGAGASNQRHYDYDASEQCALHEAPLHYFCVTCNESICSDCAMFENKHRDHNFERLNKVYERHVALIQHEIGLIQTRLSQLQAVHEGVEGNVRLLKQAAEQRRAELETFVQEVLERLNNQLKAKLAVLLGHKREVYKESQLLETILSELSGQIDRSVCPRTMLIKKTPELRQMLTEIHQKPVSSYYRAAVSASFASEIAPSWHTASLTLHNFAQLRVAEQVVYSEPLMVNGMKWRLKVYPNGLLMPPGFHISFLLFSSLSLSVYAIYPSLLPMFDFFDSSHLPSPVCQAMVWLGVRSCLCFWS